jgi:hypothetical protein
MHIIWDIDNRPTPYFVDDGMHLEAQVFYTDIPVQASADELLPSSQDDNAGEGKLLVPACSSVDAASKGEDIAGEELHRGADSAEAVATNIAEPPSTTWCYYWSLDDDPKMYLE